MPSARAGAQDVPNTSYKPDDGRGSAPELVLTPDALAYYKKLDDKRKKMPMKHTPKLRSVSSSWVIFSE